MPSPPEPAAGTAGATPTAERPPHTAGSTPWLVALTPLLPWLVALPGGGWLLPLVAPLPLFPAFAARVRAARYLSAWALAMLWAALLSAGVIVLVHLAPELAARGILNGEPYRQEMFGWIETGEGKEVTPSRFVPEHLLHLGVFLLLTWATGGYLGLVLGAALMAYMSYFVAAFALASGEPLLGSLVAWVPWSVVRVAAFVLFGALLARPLLARGRARWGRREWRLTALAATGILVDLVVKITLAPSYGVLLRSLLHD